MPGWTTGDTFTANTAVGGAYNLTITWRGRWSSTSFWNVDAPPTIAFTTPVGGPTQFSSTVSAATPSRPRTAFWVNLRVNATSGTPLPLASTADLSVGGDTYRIAFTDTNFDGDVNVGDRVSVTRSLGLLPNTDYTYLLLWLDGSVVASVLYHSP